MRIMFLIVKFLYQSDAKNEFVAMTIKEITDLLSENDYPYKERTIYNKLKELMKQGYVKTGMKEGKAWTFYVSKAGIEWMREKETDVDKEDE